MSEKIKSEKPKEISYIDTSPEKSVDLNKIVLDIIETIDSMGKSESLNSKKEEAKK